MEPKRDADSQNWLLLRLVSPDLIQTGYSPFDLVGELQSWWAMGMFTFIDVVPTSFQNEPSVSDILLTKSQQGYRKTEFLAFSHRFAHLHHDNSPNSCRTRFAPVPTNISSNSEPDAWKNGTSASPATARASNDLPMPGGPTNSTPDNTSYHFT